MKEKFKKLIPWLTLFVLIFIVFRSWFSLKEISAGDAGFYFKQNLKNLSFFPHSWLTVGMGRFSSLLFSFFYLIFPLKMLSLLDFSWVLIERACWYWPFLVLSIFSSWFLLKIILPKIKFSFLAPFVYLFNTYILMIIDGGQISIALAYSIFPLVIALLIQNLHHRNLILSIISGLVFSLQISFEPRVAALALLIFIFYLFWLYGLAFWRYLVVLLVPLAITFGVHFYWILPTVLLRKGSYSPGLSSPGWTEFLSFAHFSDSFSLLHPNWPENIFGKTYFFRPEFLLLPILAFISLLFINGLKSSRVKKHILFFAFLALTGAFLAKGSNPPFGGVYLWLFNHLPGMNLFRDASKFYVLVALSYSVLIPVSVSKIHEWLKMKKFIPNLFIIFVIFCLLFLIRPAVLGQLRGAFKAKTVPQDYFEFKDFISNQNDFFRTFWVPKKQRFGFFSNSHPAIDAESFVTDSVCREPFCFLKEKMTEEWGKDCFPNDRCYVRELSYFLNPQTARILSQMAVKYVVVPYDSEEEIFLAERQYNHQQRKEVEAFLNIVPWLKKIDVAEKIAVYELPGFKDHFFALGEEIPEIQWQMVNQTKYKVQVKNANQSFELIFSETYDKLWQAKIGEQTIFSKPFEQILNSFEIPETGNFELEVSFAPQKYVYCGGVVSLVTLLLSFGGLIYLKRQK